MIRAELPEGSGGTGEERGHWPDLARLSPSRARGEAGHSGQRGPGAGMSRTEVTAGTSSASPLHTDSELN